MAMLTLFRICTGDNGSGIFLDTMRTSPNCNSDEACKEHCCANTPMVLVPFYFMSFTVLAQFIMLNLVVAVLMAQLDEAQDALKEEEEQECVFALGPAGSQGAEGGLLKGFEGGIKLDGTGLSHVGKYLAADPVMRGTSGSSVTPMGSEGAVVENTPANSSHSAAPHGTGTGVPWVRRISRAAWDGIENARETGRKVARARFREEHADDEALCDFVLPDHHRADGGIETVHVAAL